MSYKSKNNLTPIVILALIALMGIAGYQWYSNSQLKQSNQALQTELFDLEKVSAELDQDYQAALEGLEELRGDNLELNTLIDSQKKQLETQKSKINNLIWSKRELDKARDEIKNLRTLADQYIAETTRLREDNAQLLAQNTALSAEKQDLQEKYTVEKAVNEELSQERAVLAAQKDKLSTSNQKLNIKVDIAEAIKLNSIEVNGYSVSDDGKEKKKRRAKNINMIRTCFLTETNIVAPTGPTEFRVRMIDPLGETLYTDNLGGGVLTDKLTNTQVRYTTSGVMEYKNKDTRGCIDWDVPFKLGSGEYDIQVYNNDFMVGEGTFELK